MGLAKLSSGPLVKIYVKTLYFCDKVNTYINTHINKIIVFVNIHDSFLTVDLTDLNIAGYFSSGKTNKAAKKDKIIPDL